MTETETTPADVGEICTAASSVLTALEDVVVGHLTPLRLALAAVLAGGHVLFEDSPGLGKTLAARSLAGALGLSVNRLQCTPDLLPADITGSFVYDPSQGSFTFHPGPIFTGALLVDEINRASPKTQSALLEAMQEGQVTVDGRTFPLPKPFHVLATANPIEYEGTFPLPEAQLDRFMLRLEFGYPDRTGETEILRRRLSRHGDYASVAGVVALERLAELQAGVERVDVHPDVVAYCVDIAAATRSHPAVEVGCSPRGAAALLLVARALAATYGRGLVLPEDVKMAAVPAVAHRIILKAETWATKVTRTDVVFSVLSMVPGPPTVPARATG
jgi:MoxR-like ATPase